MSVEVLNARFYDTVADVEFGPQCATDAEAANLYGHIWRTRGIDIREATGALRMQALSELRDGSALGMKTHAKMACFCGSGLAWIHRSEQLNKPAKTTCEHCLGTEAPFSKLEIAP